MTVPGTDAQTSERTWCLGAAAPLFGASLAALIPTIRRLMDGVH